MRGIVGLLVIAAAAIGAGTYFSGAFTSKASPQVTRVIVVPTKRHVLTQLRSSAVRPGDRVDLAGTGIQCLVGRANGIYVECAPLQSDGGFREGSHGVVIRDEGAFVCRLVQSRCGRTTSRSQPGTAGLVFVPLPSRAANTFSAAPGSVIPIGGTSVICNVELSAGARTLLCGLARNVIGTKDLEVIYAAASYGIRIGAAEAAIIRWRRDGTPQTVVARAEKR
jgi:hypothetical protein